MKCGEVGGSVTADGDVACDAVGSGVQAGGDVHCAGVEGNVTAGGDVACGGVTGDVRSGGDVACGSVGGSVRAGGDVVCRKDGDGFVFTTGERNVEVSDVAETVEDIRRRQGVEGQPAGDVPQEAFRGGVSCNSFVSNCNGFVYIR